MINIFSEIGTHIGFIDKVIMHLGNSIMGNFLKQLYYYRSILRQISSIQRIMITFSFKYIKVFTGVSRDT